jgi:hypothetical protein
MSATKFSMPEMTSTFPTSSRNSDQLSNLFADASSDGPERRRSVREPMVTRGQLRAVMGLQSDPLLEVLVVDVSLHGVGLRSAESLQVGDLYHVEIGAGPLHLTSRARVVRCRLRRDGNFDIGAEFC